MLGFKKKVKQDIVIIPPIFNLGTGNILSKDQPLDVKNMAEFKAIIKKWCLQNDFILPDEGSPFGLTPNIIPEDKLLQKAIFETNFQSLYIPQVFDNFMLVYKDTATDFTSARIKNLYLYIVTYLDSEFLNRYVNKFYSTLRVMTPDPYKNLWNVIFEGFLEFWVVYAIQIELHEITERFTANKD